MSLLSELVRHVLDGSGCEAHRAWDVRVIAVLVCLRDDGLGFGVGVL